MMQITEEFLMRCGLKYLNQARLNSHDSYICSQYAKKLNLQELYANFLSRSIRVDRNNQAPYLEYANQLLAKNELTEALVVLQEASRFSKLPEKIKKLIGSIESKHETCTASYQDYLCKTGQLPSKKNNQQKLKILVITNLLPPQEMGGFGRTVWEFIDCFLKRGHEVLALTADMPHLQKAPCDEYQFVEQHVRRVIRLCGDWVDGKVVLEENKEEIQNILKSNCVSILNAVNSFNPDVCMLGNLDLIGYHYINNISQMKIPMLHRLGNATPSFPQSFSFDKKYYVLAGCSRWLNDDIMNQGYEFDNVTVVYPGSPVEYYYKYFDPEFDYLRICFASLLMSYKGAQTLVESLAILKECNIPFKCELAGDTTSEAFVKTLKDFAVDREFSDCIQFKGFLSKLELSEMFARCNILVFPSIFDEPFGKTQIEAMAAGLCVVSSGTGGAKEIVQHDVNGVIFEKGNSQDLAFQLASLFKEKGRWGKLASQGKKDAFKYTTQKSVERIESEFYTFLNSNS